MFSNQVCKYTHYHLFDVFEKVVTEKEIKFLEEFTKPLIEAIAKETEDFRSGYNGLSKASGILCYFNCSPTTTGKVVSYLIKKIDQIDSIDIKERLN